MSTGKTNATSQPRLYGVQVTTSVYNQAIPMLYGKRRVSGKLIWYGDFQPGPSSKKGKANKKGITTYQANVDLLVSFGPLWGTVNTYNNSTLIGYDYPNSGATFAHCGKQTVSVTSGSYTLTNGRYVYSSSVSVPGGNTLDGIYAISITPTAATTASINDYGDPLGSRTIIETLTEEWLYNTYNNYGSSGAGAVAWRPGAWEFGQPFCNSDSCSYPIGTDWGGASWSVSLNSAIAGTITVYYLYHENSHSTPLSFIKYEFEPELGSGNEYSSTPSQQITYPDVSGYGGVAVDLGASGTAPELQVEPIGQYSLTKTGQCNPADIMLDLILSGNIYFGYGPLNWHPICWSHGLNFAGDPTRENYQTGGPDNPGTAVFPPTICFPYTLPTVNVGPSYETNGAPFQILKDPPTFNQGTYVSGTTYNVNSIVLYSGLYYKAITFGDTAPLSGNPYWSVFIGSFSDGMSDVRKYCAANGIYASLYLDSQKDCSQILGELCEIANCVAVWNGQALDFYPLSEVSAVGGGYTYMPRTASGPLASFDNRHLVADENESPITIKHYKEVVCTGYVQHWRSQCWVT